MGVTGLLAVAADAALTAAALDVAALAACGGAWNGLLPAAVLAAAAAVGATCRAPEEGGTTEVTQRL